jgi:impB/mucB/samB family protein
LLDGEFTIKSDRRRGSRRWLEAANPDHANIELGEERGFEVWGCLKAVVRVKRCQRPLHLVDCNNFYASRERVFDPRRRGRPVVVLSNNDGCVVARSNEAKAPVIERSQPAHSHCVLAGNRCGQLSRACRHPPAGEFDAMLPLKSSDVLSVEPNGELDRDRHAVVGEHEVLQRLVPQLVVADRGDDERSCVGCRVLFAVDDDARRVRPCGCCL